MRVRGLGLVMRGKMQGAGLADDEWIFIGRNRRDMEHGMLDIVLA